MIESWDCRCTQAEQGLIFNMDGLNLLYNCIVRVNHGRRDSGSKVSSEVSVGLERHKRSTLCAYKPSHCPLEIPLAPGIPSLFIAVNSPYHDFCPNPHHPFLLVSYPDTPLAAGREVVPLFSRSSRHTLLALTCKRPQKILKRRR